MSNYKKHFERELEIMRKDLEKGDKLIIEPFIEDIYSIIRKFSDEGHSGGSAPYASGALAETIKRVLEFKPLSPITGEDSEWGEQLSNTLPHFQNKRLSAVFKDTAKDPRAYYLDAIVWSGEDEWDNFTGTMEGITSRQYIRFPFTPKTFYIDVVRELYDVEKHGEDCDYTQCGTGDFVYSIKDHKQLDAVKEYYDFPFNEKERGEL